MASSRWRPADRAGWARTAIVPVAWLLTVALLGQVLLAGLGVFAGAKWWPRHQTFVNYFQWLSPIAFALAFLGRSTRAVKWLAGATLLLLWMQYWTAGLRLVAGRERWAALHAVFGVLLFWAASELARRAWRDAGADR